MNRNVWFCFNMLPHPQEKCVTASRVFLFVCHKVHRNQLAHRPHKGLCKRPHARHIYTMFERETLERSRCSDTHVRSAAPCGGGRHRRARGGQLRRYGHAPCCHQRQHRHYGKRHTPALQDLRRHTRALQDLRRRLNAKYLACIQAHYGRPIHAANRCPQAVF